MFKTSIDRHWSQHCALVCNGMPQRSLLVSRSAYILSSLLPCISQIHPHCSILLMYMVHKSAPTQTLSNVATLCCLKLWWEAAQKIACLIGSRQNRVVQCLLMPLRCHLGMQAHLAAQADEVPPEALMMLPACKGNGCKALLRSATSVKLKLTSGLALLDPA